VPTALARFRAGLIFVEAGLWLTRRSLASSQRQTIRNASKITWRLELAGCPMPKHGNAWPHSSSDSNTKVLRRASLARIGDHGSKPNRERSSSTRFVPDGGNSVCMCPQKSTRFTADDFHQFFLSRKVPINLARSLHQCTKSIRGKRKVSRLKYFSSSERIASISRIPFLPGQSLLC
jgi:hypothetical protein